MHQHRLDVHVTMAVPTVAMTMGMAVSMALLFGLFLRVLNCELLLLDT